VRVWFAGGGTGGHLYPALGIARALVTQVPAVRPLFIGALRGIERDVLPAAEFEHALLELHPLYRSRVWRNWKTLTSAGSAWRALRRLARSEPPRVVVATGGYAAALALLYAVVHRIPIALQEQNSVPGITTRFFSRFARQIHLGFPEAAKALHPPGGALVAASGNPIEPPPMLDEQGLRRARERWGFTDPDSRVLLVFGGSQGARALNTAVAELVRAGLPGGMRLLWITGKGEHERYTSLASGTTRVLSFLTPMTDAYAAADLALARAGAMSTAELCAWGIPAVLVPLPTAAADHQTTNARALEAAGAAVVIPQTEFTPHRLRLSLEELLQDEDRLGSMAAAARVRARPDAAARIAAEVATLITRDER
jgi:UDP-N-acetylglucosamine--N-acetylmuramyl-(pentapeptide) pyrophosphoryl-undecaprenol N-acetylglucosamine transferase